jgi:adenylate kinase
MDTQDKMDHAAGMLGTSASNSPGAGKVPRTWRLVLLGAPGVGKGTQSELLKHRLGVCHISTGDLFRAAGSLKGDKQTPAMAEALKYMRRGELVPDAIVWGLVRDQSEAMHSRKGFLLDGFPRTLAQAEHLKQFAEEEKLPLSAVVDYEMPHSEIIFRLSGRRICAKCKSVYHVSWRPSKVEGVCDECGGRLYRRDDDNPESIAIRLEAYQRSTAPLVKFYKDLSLLASVDAVGSAEEVFTRTMSALQTRV